MEISHCPNMNVCKLVTEVGFTGNEAQRNDYIQAWCKTDEAKWSKCKRLITKEVLKFCPDFVLPDTPLTPDEIIDKFDEEVIK